MRRLLHYVAFLLPLLWLAGCTDNSTGGPAPKAASSASPTTNPVPPPPPPPPGPPSPALPAPSSPAPLATPQSAAPVRMPIRLSTGVALPQTGPEGTLMSFSVDYSFDQGEPNPSGYSLVIERTRGAPAKQSVRLARKGDLPVLVSGWRPEDGPFRAYIEDLDGNRVSGSIDLR